MKKLTKFFMATFLTLICHFSYAQTTYEWEKQPQSNEIQIDVFNKTISAGFSKDEWDKKMNLTDGGYSKIKNYSKEQLYNEFLKLAKNKYAETYPKFILRSFKFNDRTEYEHIETRGNGTKYRYTNYYYDCSAIIVIPDPVIEANKKFVNAITKALEKIKPGSRLAIDQIKVANGDKEDFKDKIVEVLLDEGYKVVAKEYLEKLYEEQQAQQSGIYNDRTTVQENNFSAVGYYINVKQTETAIKVQVINVSTGEYEANTTVNLD